MSDNEDNAGSEPEVDAEEAPKKGKGTKRKGKKDANKPKRPLSAYMFFCQAKRAETKAANPNMTFSELGKELGQMWQKLDESEKKPFIKQNERDKKRYEEEKEKYGPVDDEEDGGKKKKAKGGKKKDKDAPKNAKSAYMFFCNDERKRLKEEDPSISFGEIGKKMGENWKKLSDDKKQKYVDMATADKADKDAAKAEYNEKNPGKAKKTKKAKKAAEEDDDAADDAEGGDDDDAE